MASRNREAGYSLLELSLAIAVALTILASGFWMVKQHNAEARVQQSKMMLATLRTALSASRYRYGAYPPAASISANDGGGGERLVANVASISEPVSGVAIVQTATVSYGGWFYDPTSGTIRANLDPADYPGDDPSQW